MTVNGLPDEAVKNAFNCQPPTTLARTLFVVQELPALAERQLVDHGHVHLVRHGGVGAALRPLVQIPILRYGNRIRPQSMAFAYV